MVLQSGPGQVGRHSYRGHLLNACHTGLVWETNVEGRSAPFSISRASTIRIHQCVDEETGLLVAEVTGEVSRPLERPSSQKRLP